MILSFNSDEFSHSLLIAPETNGTGVEMRQFHLEVVVGFKRLSARAANTTTPQRQGCFIYGAKLQ